MKRAWPIWAERATGATPKPLKKVSAGDGVALVLVDAPREDRQQHEVERQDGEGAAAAHPPAQLLGAHGDDASTDAVQAIEQAAEGVPRGRRGDHRSAPGAWPRPPREP